MKKTAQVYKIHSDFYYVHCNNEVIECKLKDTLKKQKQEVVVGDIVALEEINEKSKQAFISQIESRKSFIPRPKVANIEQMIIVSAIKEPELDLHQLNRYLCLCEHTPGSATLCRGERAVVCVAADAACFKSLKIGVWVYSFDISNSILLVIMPLAPMAMKLRASAGSSE